MVRPMGMPPDQRSCKELLQDSHVVLFKLSNLIVRIYGSVADDRSVYINELLAAASQLEHRVQQFLANTGTVQRAGADRAAVAPDSLTAGNGNKEIQKIMPPEPQSTVSVAQQMRQALK